MREERVVEETVEETVEEQQRKRNASVHRSLLEPWAELSSQSGLIANINGNAVMVARTNPSGSLCLPQALRPQSRPESPTVIADHQLRGLI